MESLTKAIEKRFSLPVSLYPQNISLYHGYDPIRNQINSSWLLGKIKEVLPGKPVKILGVTEYDLFIPIFTYVFGEAELNGRAAVISTYRFNNDLYGLEPDGNNDIIRLVKESTHELGHTFGLVHCLNHHCVMRSSNYVEDIDLKTEHFCQKCLRIISQRIN